MRESTEKLIKSELEQIIKNAQKTLQNFDPRTIRLEIRYIQDNISVIKTELDYDEKLQSENVSS